MLSERLQSIMKYVSAETAADIGTDHAYIPIELIKTNICSRVIATDIEIGPAKIAKRNIEKEGLDNKIEIRIGDGLEPIKEGECQTCIIAGMGGNAIINILKNKTLLSPEYILQPMNYQYDLRKYLYSEKFQIIGEDIAVEGFKVYNILIARKGNARGGEPPEFNYHIPKCLYNNKNIDALKAKKRREFLRIKTGLEKSTSANPEEIKKYGEFLSELEKI